MSMPYIPGWWDEINKNGAISNLVQQLPQMIQPDNVANRRLQQMVQQNPMILEQMSNMDEGTRKLLEQSLGFRKNAPISTLPVGAQRQERELNQRLLNEAMATPEGAAEVRASRTGTLRANQREAENLSIQGAKQDLEYKKLNFEKLTDDVGIGKLLNAEKERALKKLQEYRANNKIDPIGLVERIATNKATQSDLEMFSVISNEPGMGDALNKMLEFRQMRDNQRNSLYLRTAGMQDDFLRLAVQTVSQASQEYNKASRIVNDIVGQAALSKISVEEALAADKQRAAMYQEALAVRNESKQLLDSYRPLVKAGFEKFGVKFPEVTPGAGSSTSPSAVDPAVETKRRLEEAKRRAGIK